MAELSEPSTSMQGAARAMPRASFADTARGICIIMVVMMHSALGVGVAMNGTGFVHDIIAFAKPFRMPDFFMVSGLFIAGSLTLPWRQFLDRKVVHFAYFYGLWLLIILLVKAGELRLLSPGAFLEAYAAGLVEPFSTLWFIHLLPFFFLFARLTRGLAPFAVLFLAVALHLLAASWPGDDPYAMGSTLTRSTMVNSFCLYLIYFLIGHHFRARIFAFARLVSARPKVAIFGLIFWALEQAIGVRTGLADIPGFTLFYAIFGVLAVVTLASLLERWRCFDWLAICGRHSLTIYLSFVLPMAAGRLVLVKSQLFDSVGLVSALVTAGAIMASLALGAAVRGMWLGFLFRRPAWAHLASNSAGATSPPARLPV